LNPFLKNAFCVRTDKRINLQKSECFFALKLFDPIFFSAGNGVFDVPFGGAWGSAPYMSDGYAAPCKAAPHRGASPTFRANKILNKEKTYEIT